MEQQDIEMSHIVTMDNNMYENISDKSLCEQRLISDISEFKRSQLIGTTCKIKLNNYIKNNNNFELIIEFIDYFSTKFIFNSKYPVSPPSIVYYNGKKIKNIFDTDGNVLLESIKIQNWNEGVWLSTLVFSIELLISKEIEEENNVSNLNSYINNTDIVKDKYGKRKWNNYIEEEKNNHLDYSTSPELEKNLKKLK